MQIHSDGQKWTDQPKTPTYICSEISQHLFLSFKNLNATYRGKGKCGMTACFYGWISWVMPKNRIWIFLIFVGMNANILGKMWFLHRQFLCVCVCVLRQMPLRGQCKSTTTTYPLGRRG